MKKTALQSVFSIFLLFSIFIGFAPKASASSFTDVNPSNMDQETFDAIMYVSDNGIMNGTSNTDFSPRMTMTRAQIVQLLYNMVGSPSVSGKTCKYYDVSSSAWYYKAVVWADSNGIVNGTSNTTFSPEVAITMEQTMCILYRYATKYRSYASNPLTSISSYADYRSISDWARSAVQWAVSNGVIIPTSNTAYLHPQSRTLRQEMALYICRFGKRVEGFTRKKLLNFVNNGIYFFQDNETRNLTISEPLAQQIEKQIKAEFGSNSQTATTYINKFRSRMQKNWTGACNGMSFVMLYDVTGRINFNKYVGGYVNMYSVPLPKTNKIIRDGIHYYQSTADLIAKYRTEYHDSFIPAGMEILNVQVAKFGPTPFTYYWHGAEGLAGHTVIVTKVTKQKDGYLLTIINSDNSLPTDKKMAMSNGSTAFAGKTLSTIGFFTPSSLNEMAYLDLDGLYNNAIARRSIEKDSDIYYEAQEADELAGKTYITTLAYPFEIQMEDGTYLNYDGYDFTGTASIDSIKYNPYNDEVAEIILVLQGEHTITFNNLDDNPCSFFVATSQYTKMVEGDNVSSIDFSKDSINTNVRYAGNIKTILFTEQNEMITLSGKVRSTAKISNQENILLVSGVESEGTVKFSSDERSIPITCDNQTITVPSDTE